MTEEITLERVHSSVGSLLHLWALIEKAAREEVVRAHDGLMPRSVHGIAATLNAWEASIISKATTADVSLRLALAAKLRSRLQEALDVRNGICHGLVGCSSNLGGRTASLTWEINGSRRTITWDEMQDLLSWLALVPRSMSIISDFGSGGVDRVMRNNPENLVWWRSELGLSV